jgi:hypothetical protein
MIVFVGTTMMTLEARFAWNFEFWSPVAQDKHSDTHAGHDDFLYSE